MPGQETRADPEAEAAADLEAEATEPELVGAGATAGREAGASAGREAGASAGHGAGATVQSDCTVQGEATHQPEVSVQPEAIVRLEGSVHLEATASLEATADPEVIAVQGADPVMVETTATVSLEGAGTHRAHLCHRAEAAAHLGGQFEPEAEASLGNIGRRGVTASLMTAVIQATWTLTNSCHRQGKRT